MLQFVCCVDSSFPFEITNEMSEHEDEERMEDATQQYEELKELSETKKKKVQDRRMLFENNSEHSIFYYLYNRQADVGVYVV